MDFGTVSQQGPANDVVSGQACKEQKDAAADASSYLSMVDPFLVEALQNPRHRLTILRMELDIQKFLQTPDAQQFEFVHFPTSYLRLAAHRVAQHYGLQTMVQDNVLEGQGTRILVRKTGEMEYPAVCLSDIPAKQSENEKFEQIKIVLKPRPSAASSNDNGELGLKRNLIRTVEERKEEYDKARARIFNSPGSSESEYALARTASENESLMNSLMDYERNIANRENGSSSKVAILRDREKDRFDPDYDRSYQRYTKNIPTTQSYGLTPFNMQNIQPPFVQYDSVFPQLNQMPQPQPQAAFNYRGPVMNPFCTMGLDQTPRNPVYMQWPTQSMMYAQSYDQLRHAVYQVPLRQQPLSFDYSQHHF